jgi:hypothetical protein
MISPPRNRSAKATTPRKKLVLRLSQIRCTECGASANVKYLRPFLTFWTEDGWVILCKLCGRTQQQAPQQSSGVIPTTTPELTADCSPRAA